MGPTSSMSFNDTPVKNLAEASKTALTLLVVLDSHAWEDRTHGVFRVSFRDTVQRALLGNIRP